MSSCKNQALKCVCVFPSYDGFVYIRQHRPTDVSSTVMMERCISGIQYALGFCLNYYIGAQI